MQGLTSEQARRLLDEYGPNEPVRAKRWTALRELVSLVANPLVLILLAAALVSAFVGEPTDAILVVVMVTAGVGINLRRPEQQPNSEASRQGFLIVLPRRRSNRTCGVSEHSFFAPSCSWCCCWY